jgi:hypothetical protein
MLTKDKKLIAKIPCPCQHNFLNKFFECPDGLVQKNFQAGADRVDAKISS